MPKTSSTQNNNLFITPAQQQEIKHKLLNADGVFPSINRTQAQGARTRADGIGSNTPQGRETPIDDNVILQAINQINTEHQATNTVTLDHKIKIVKAKLNDMRQAQRAQQPAIPLAKQQSDSKTHCATVTKQEALAAIAQHHAQAQPEIVNDLDLHTENMFVRQFGAAFQSGLNIQPTEPTLVLETVLEQTDRFLSCYDIGKNDTHFLLCEGDLKALQQHRRDLNQIHAILPYLSEHYSKNRCQEIARQIYQKITDLQIDNTYLLPVLRHTAENSTVMHVVLFTRTDANHFTVSLNAPNPLFHDVHPATVDPQTGKNKFATVLTQDNISAEGLFWNNKMSLILEGLVELSLNDTIATNPTALYVLLGRLGGHPAAATDEPATFHAPARISSNHFKALQRLQEIGQTGGAPGAYQRTALALTLHGIEAHLLRWQNILTDQPAKGILLERTLQNLARRGVKLQRSGVIDENQITQLRNRLEAIKSVLNAAQETRNIQQQTQVSSWQHHKLTDTPTIRITPLPSNTPAQAHANKLIVTVRKIQPASRVLRRPHLNDMNTWKALHTATADLMAFMNECDSDAQYELQRLVVGDFARNLPMPSHEDESFWHQLPVSHIQQCSKQLSQLAERYIRNEANLPVRIPERALVVGKFMVILALLAQRVPKLGLKNRHISSIDNFFRHEFTDYGYALHPTDNAQLYKLVSWAEASRTQSEGEHLDFTLPEKDHKFQTASISVLRAELDHHIHQPTLLFFSNFVKGSSKLKKDGKPNPNYNALRYKLKQYLKEADLFPETTARKRRHLRRDNYVLAMTLMTCIGNDDNPNFFQDERTVLNDLRRVIVFSQISRHTSPKSLLDKNKSGKPVPIQLELRYREYGYPKSPFERFLFGQCVLDSGGKLYLYGPGLTLSKANLLPPKHGQRLHWEQQQFKILMTGSDRQAPTRPTRPTRPITPYHYHGRSDSDNEILLRHYKAGSAPGPSQLRPAEMNMAKPKLIVRKALAYYRDHLSLLEQQDHQKQLALMLSRNEPYFQSPQQFVQASNGGTLHHELVVDTENFVSQLKSFFKASLFHFNTEEKLAPLLYLAQLSQTVQQHIEIAAPQLVNAEELADFPSGQDILTSLLFNEFIFTTDDDRAKIAKHLLISLAQDSRQDALPQQLALAATALTVVNTVSIDQPDWHTLNDHAFEHARLRYEAALQQSFERKDHREQSYFIEQMLHMLEKVLAPTNLGHLKVSAFEYYWLGEFPIYHNETDSIDLTRGEIYRHGHPIANRLPSAIRQHNAYKSLFGTTQPITTPLTDETGATLYSILDDRYRLQLQGSNQLEIQQAFTLDGENLTWFTNRSHDKHRAAASIYEKLTPLLPETLILWEGNGLPAPQTHPATGNADQLWLATQKSDLNQPVYKISLNYQTGALNIQPQGREAENLIPLPQNPQDPVLSTLPIFESAKHISLWQDSNNQKVTRLSFERFNIEFERDSHTNDLVWTQNKDYRLSPKYLPLIPGFKGALQLQHRQKANKGLLLLPRGPLIFVDAQQFAADNANGRQPANTVKLNYFHKVARIVPGNYFLQPKNTKGMYSTIAIPYSASGETLAETNIHAESTEAKLRMALIHLGTGNYRQAVRWITQAKTLKPLTHHEQQAVDAILRLNGQSGDWFADAVATRVHLHGFLADNAQGETTLTPAQAESLEGDLKRYADLHNNVQSPLRAPRQTLLQLIKRLDETNNLKQQPNTRTALTENAPLSASVAYDTDAPLALIQGQTKPNDWQATKEQLLKIIDPAFKGNTSAIASPAEHIPIPILTQADDVQIAPLFESIFNSRVRPLTKSELMTFINNLPIVSPPVREFKSLFKSILLIVQRNIINLEEKLALKNRIQLVDPHGNIELAHTRQLLLILLEQPSAAFRRLTYPIDSWQRPTTRQSNPYSREHYTGELYDQRFRDIENDSDNYSGAYTYNSDKNGAYYLRKKRYRGSYNTFEKNGYFTRVNRDIEKSEYIEERAKKRGIFINAFKLLLPEANNVNRAETITATTKVFTAATNGDVSVRWPHNAVPPNAPIFNTGNAATSQHPGANNDGFILAIALTADLRGLAQPVTRANDLGSDNNTLDLTSLTNGPLISTQANHAPVLDEQTKLYQQHIKHWFSQSTIEYNLSDTLDLNTLQQTLTQWLSITRPQLSQDKADLVAFANNDSDPLRHQTRQLATLGQTLEPLSWEMLMIRLAQGNTQALVDSNPSLDDKAITKINESLLSQLTLETSIQQAERALALSNEILNLEASASDAHRIQQLKSDLAAQLNARRHFDIHQFPEYLVWETVGGIILRDNQVRTLDKLLHRPDANTHPSTQEAVVQLIMGAGKTKALLPLYMALATKMDNTLPVAMVPRPLLEINAGDLSKGLEAAFGQLGYIFNYNRASSTLPGHMQDIQDRYANAITQNRYMITSRESIQTLELKLQELLEGANNTIGKERQSLADQADQLAEFINTFKKSSAVLIDEIDNGLDTRYEVNYTVGKTVGLMPERLDLVTQIYEVIMTQQELPFAEKLANNEQASLPNTVFSTQNKDALAYEVLSNASVFQAYLGLLQNDNDLLDYLTGQIPSPPKIVSDLAASEETREVAQLLVLLKEQINTLLPATLSKSGGESYGFSTKDPNCLTPGPRDKGKHKEGSNFANPYETLNFLYQLVADQSFAWQPEQVTRWIQALQKQQQQEVAASSVDPANTKAQQIYTQVTAAVAPQFKQLVDIYSQNKASIRLLTNTLNKDVVTRLRLARHLAAPTITQAPRKLSNTPYDLVDASGHVQGFSGTLWNATTFPQRLSPTLVAETDGKVTKILVDSEKTNIAVLISRAPAQILQELDSKNALKSNTRAFIDAGAVFRGLPGVSVADALLNHFKQKNTAIKGVLYFDQKDQLNMRFQDGRTQVLPDTDADTLTDTGLDPSERFTYYDQPRTVGTDIAQTPTAHALVSLGLNTTKRDWFQGILRMRQPTTQQFTIVVPSVALDKINDTANTDLTQPSMANLIGHTISNESARLAIDKFRAATQQLKNNAIRAMKRELLNERGESRVKLYGYLSPLMSENLLDDPLSTMATISHVETKDAIELYRDTLVQRLTRHKTTLEDLRAKTKDDAYRALNKALGIINTQISNLDLSDLDELIHRLGALPHTVRSTGGEGFGAEVENEQEVEVEIEAEEIVYQATPENVTTAKTLPWQLPADKNVYSTPTLLQPTNEPLQSNPTSVTLHRVTDYGQANFFSERLLASNNFLKTTSRAEADLFSNMTACPTQKPVSFILVNYENSENFVKNTDDDNRKNNHDNNGTAEVILLSLEDQQFFMDQLEAKDDNPLPHLRRLCLCDLSGNIIRSGNSGLTQADLNNDETFQALRVEAKILNAPAEPSQTWRLEDQKRVRKWLINSEHSVQIVKKRYLEMVAPNLSALVSV